MLFEELDLGTETQSEYTVEMAEELGQEELDLANIDAEVSAKADSALIVEHYLAATERSMALSDACPEEGMETLVQGQQELYAFASSLIPMDGASEFGKEAKNTNSLYEKVKVALLKAWVAVKKTAMKVVAKVVGMVGKKDARIKELKKSVEKMTENTGAEFKEEHWKTMRSIGPVISFKSDSSEIALGMLDFQLASGVDKVRTFFEFVGKGNTKGQMKKALTDLTTKGSDLPKGLDSKFTYAALWGVAKVILIGVNEEDGKVQYISKNIGNEAKFKDNKLKPLNKSQMLSGLDTIKTYNGKFSKEVDGLFKTVDKSGKEMEKVMGEFDLSSEDDKKQFGMIKQLYSLTPRIALDATLMMNRSINFGIAIVDASLKAHKKAGK